MSDNKDGVSTARKIFFGSGSIVSIFECLFATLFFPYVIKLAIPPWVILPVCLFAAAFPLAVMPLIYELINGSPFISLGRYHIPLALSSLGLAVFSALMFNVSVSWNFAGKVSALFFSVMFSVLFLLINNYVRASMETRLCGENDKRMRNIRSIFFTVGVAAFILCFTLIYDGSVESLSGFSFISAIIVMAAGACAYFSTQSLMPMFIRIEPPRKRDIKTKYKRFFGLFAIGRNRRIYFGYYLTMTALLIFALSIENLTGAFGIDKMLAALGLLCFALAFALTVCCFGEYLSKTYGKTAVAAGVILLGCFATAMARQFVRFGEDGDMTAVFLITFLSGAACGMISLSSAKKFGGVVKSPSATKGVINNLKNMTVVCSAFTALLVATLASLSQSYSLVISFSVASAALIASLVEFFRKDKEYLTLEFPTNYD